LASSRERNGYKSRNLICIVFFSEFAASSKFVLEDRARDKFTAEMSDKKKVSFRNEFKDEAEIYIHDSIAKINLAEKSCVLRNGRKTTATA